MSGLTILNAYNAPGRGPAGLAWDGRHLWNTDYSSAKIFCIQPDTAAVKSNLICPGSLSGLAWDGRALWQVLHMDGWLRRINPQTNDFDQTLEVADHGWLSGVAWDGRQLWVASQQKGQIFALDPANGHVNQTIPAPIAGGGLTYHQESLWLSFPYPMVFNAAEHYFDWVGDEQHFGLIQIDPADGRELARYELDFLAMGLAWVGEDLWLSHAGAAKLYRARLEK